MSEDNLIERFIASFNKLDEMAEFPALKVPTDSSQLEPLLAKLPARFPYSKTSFSLTGGLKSI